VVFYDAGVGTRRFEHVIGGAFGFGLSSKVKDAYRFLIETYEPGDEIFLFGFSRGAYTARSTAGLIRNCGILRRDQATRLDAGYELYRRRDSASLPSEFESQLFRRMYACEPETRIRFIGVWDTVGALGIPSGIPWLPVSWVQSFNKRWAFHDLRLSRYVDYAYQAVAIDERRPQFQPALWEQQPGAGQQVLEQVWFAGVHTNIGGGYQDTGLSAITLLWMKDNAERCGLAFRAPYFEQEHLQPNPLGVLRDSRVGLYRWFPPTWRPIGVAPASNERISETALARLAADPTYQPKNLLEERRRRPSR